MHSSHLQEPYSLVGKSLSSSQTGEVYAAQRDSVTSSSYYTQMCDF